ncbi:hypothetical protein CWATWH0402_6029 [Crocosphaera watsonii WH 0402]|uniref:Uncharacterized protein n=3 Tax=Crocosphaera watsonii TaxID=263511 RepID=T2JXX4_CROWT|nr:hypothetical protein CWATWH0003_B338 [Crocosphaera watsonii WH 0003]CCQ56316.1 hypothetical protein CWATWH0005_5250 [Crocosphaera watsonii WH 0005]CCQ69914.1 hypothetical protein CWATWH0402_6029 [Crocosphaera watsonii WH 0402]
MFLLSHRRVLIIWVKENPSAVIATNRPPGNNRLKAEYKCSVVAD